MTPLGDHQGLDNLQELPTEWEAMAAPESTGSTPPAAQVLWGWDSQREAGRNTL